MTFTETLLRDLLRPGESLPLDEWAERHYELDKSSAIPGKYSRATAPWINDILLSWQDPEVPDMFAMLGAQLHKTSTAGLCVGKSAIDDPGPALWYSNERDQLKEFIEERLYDSWERTEPIAKILPPLKTGRTAKRCSFATMTLSFLSAASKNSRTGRPARYVLGDEIKDWEPGVWPTVKRRTTTWLGLSKCFGYSTPALAGDDVDKSFKAGDQRRWMMMCPYCETSQEFLLKHVEWDKHLTPDGDYDLAAILPTVRLCCGSCKAVVARGGITREAIAAEVQQRYALLRTGRWVVTNPGAPKGSRSWTANILINPRFPLAEFVKEYLSAKKAEKIGSLKDLQDFYQQRLSLPWDDFADDTEMKNVAAYNPAELDPADGTRIGTADCQLMNVRYALVLQWKDSKPTFVACRECHSDDEVQQFMEEHKVKPGFVGEDYGNDRSHVLAACVQRGWKGLRGDAKESFAWRMPNETYVNRPISQEFLEDPAVGTRNAGRMGRVRCRKFSNLQCKDIAAKMIRTGAFVMPVGVDAEFSKQLNSERKVKTKSGYEWQRIGKRANHYWDCLVMNIAMAICAGKLVMEIRKASTPPPADSTASQ